MENHKTSSGEVGRGFAEAPGSATARNLVWAEAELMKMQDEERDPQLRALWSTAARIARERIAAKSPNVPAHRPGANTPTL